MRIAGYRFRPLAPGDLALVARWRAMPHVAQWWGDPALEPEAGKTEDPRIAMWIVEHSGRPFAFAQDYDVHGWRPHPFSHLPAAARGIDQYIGEPDMVGLGHGSRFVAAHVRRLFGRRTDCCAGTNCLAERFLSSCNHLRQ